MIIAIDGPAGSGKSTVAKIIASKRGLLYIDTGAMYRALTLKAIRNGLDLSDSKSILSMTKDTSLELKPASSGIRVFLDGKDVSDAIRTPEVTNKIFYVADDPQVREIMVVLQRKIAGRQDSILEGRDITSVVFPDAESKFYIDASFEERCKRRWQDFKNKGMDISLEQVKKDLAERDYRDKNRPVGALKMVSGAVYIDTSNLTIDEVVDKILSVITLAQDARQ